MGEKSDQSTHEVLSLPLQGKASERGYYGYLDFPVQVGEFFIVKGQVPTHQGIQQHSHAPDVCLKVNRSFVTVVCLYQNLSQFVQNYAFRILKRFPDKCAKVTAQSHRAWTLLSFMSHQPEPGPN